LRQASAKKQLFGKTQNPALAVSRKMKDTVGVLGASKRRAVSLTDPTPEGKALRNRLVRSDTFCTQPIFRTSGQLDLGLDTLFFQTQFGQVRRLSVRNQVFF